jgi:hypothetical protein
VNLGQIRERIQNELQHAPTTTAHKNDINQVVNDVYQKRMSSERWTYRTVEGTMRLRADVTGVSFKVRTTTGKSLQLRTVTGVSAVYMHDYDALLLLASDESDSLRRFGRIAGGPSWPVEWRQVHAKYDGVHAGGWPDPDLDTVSADVAVYLDDPPAAAYQDITYTDGILRHDRYQMPFDCGEIISIVSRDDKRGEMELVNRTRERMLMMNTNQDGAGQPVAWLMDDAVDCGPAPRKTMTAATGTTGSLAAGTYRYFYAFYGKGTFSAPSNIVSIVVSGTADEVVLSALEAEPDTRYWRDKHVFRDDGDGVFRLLARVPPGTATYTDSGATAPDETFRWDDRMAAPRKAVRFWPRPSADQWVSVSYLRVPNRLVTDQDTPEMPEEYHHILVHEAIVQLAARYKQPDLIKVHAPLAAEALAFMQSKEIHRYNTVQMGSFSPRRRRRFIPTTPASMT